MIVTEGRKFMPVNYFSVMLGGPSTGRRGRGNGCHSSDYMMISTGYGWTNGGVNVRKSSSEYEVKNISTSGRVSNVLNPIMGEDACDKRYESFMSQRRLGPINLW